MRESLFLDLVLDHAGRARSLSEVARCRPLLFCFVRGWWCPKEQVRVRMLVTMQEEIQRECGKIAAVAVDPPYGNGPAAPGSAGPFPFLSAWGSPTPEELRQGRRART